LYSTVLIHRFAFAFAQDRSKRKFPNEKSYIGLLHTGPTRWNQAVCVVLHCSLSTLPLMIICVLL